MEQEVRKEPTFDLRNIEVVRWTQDVEEIDERMFNLTVSNMWLASDHKIADDRHDWVIKLTEAERETLRLQLARLTWLDSVQGHFGLDRLAHFARTIIEKTVYDIIGGVEHIHVKAYSSVFIELEEKTLADAVFDRINASKPMRRLVKCLSENYTTPDEYKVKIVSVALESFLFFTGFYYPLWLSAHKHVLTEVVSVIRSIIRDESTHGYYIGRKFQKIMQELPYEEQQKYADYAYNLFLQLWSIENDFIEETYAQVGLVEDAKKFLCYNANKAMQVLGFEDIFDSELCGADSAVITLLNAEDINDFFSTTGTDYKTVSHEEGTDEMWLTGVI